MRANTLSHWQRNVKHNLSAWLLVGPFALSMLVFFVYALLKTVGYSFARYDLFTAPEWTGLNNYLGLFTDPLFYRALINTFSFSLVVTFTQTALALILAAIINGNIRGKSFFRTVYYLPSIMSSAAITLIFIWFYQKNGFLNQFLSSLINHWPHLSLFVLLIISSQLTLVFISRKQGQPSGITDPYLGFISAAVALLITGLCARLGWLDVVPTQLEISWLGSRDMVGPMPLTLWAIVLQNVFTTVPTLMLLFLAGLQGIPNDLYEAASIDGASKVQQFWHITLPQLAPVTFVVVTMGIIGTLQIFDQVALLGSTVPLESRITLAYYVYHYAFPDGTSPQIGIASAAALMLGVITLMFVWLQNRFGVKEKQHG